MSVVAERARAAQPAPERVVRPRPRTRREPRVASGAVWIVLVAVLLGGVVAMNVAVLRLNLRLDSLGRDRAKLRADNALLSSELSSAAASNRIENVAAQTLGLVQAQTDQTTYVDLSGR